MADIKLMQMHLEKALGENYLSLSDHQIQQFSTFYECLLEKSKVMNLTTILDEQGVAIRHFADSLLVDRMDMIKSGQRIIDIGAGAGLPCVPIAIARPDVFITAVEATNKKAEFIKESANDCGLENLSVISERSEELSHYPLHRFTYDICVSRAVAKLNILLELCAGFVKMNGYFLAYKGEKAMEEKDQAQKACSLLGLLYIGEKRMSDDDDHVLLIYQRIKNMPDNYPRRYAAIKKRPL